MYVRRCFDCTETEAGLVQGILLFCPVTPTGKAFLYMHPRKSPDIPLSLSTALWILTTQSVFGAVCCTHCWMPGISLKPQRCISKFCYHFCCADYQPVMGFSWLQVIFSGEGKITAWEKALTFAAILWQITPCQIFWLVMDDSMFGENRSSLVFKCPGKTGNVDMNIYPI